MEAAVPTDNLALVVDPDPAARTILHHALRQRGYVCAEADSFMAARAGVESATYTVVFATLDLGGRSGLELLQALRARGFDTGFILVGGRSVEQVLVALRGGADDYLPRPVRDPALVDVLARAHRARAARVARRAHELALEALLASRQVDPARLAQDASLNALSRLAANLAHEINNPLTPIIGMASLINDELPAGHIARTYVETIVASAQRIRDIVRSMLDFARPSALQRAPIDLSALIRTTLLLVAQQLRDSAIVTALALPDKPLIATASEAQIKQMLLLLIDNAREAMPNGGTLRLQLSQERDHVSGARRALIAIGDTGTGIADGHKPYIFEPFYSTKTQVTGVGLGLAVANSIVQAHGGAIEFESVEERGSTFRVLLPLDDA
jgi:two-component system, NtrC family, sensor kinase